MDIFFCYARYQSTLSICQDLLPSCFYWRALSKLFKRRMCKIILQKFSPLPPLKTHLIFFLHYSLILFEMFSLKLKSDLSAYINFFKKSVLKNWSPELNPILISQVVGTFVLWQHKFFPYQTILRIILDARFDNQAQFFLQKITWSRIAWILVWRRDITCIAE